MNCSVCGGNLKYENGIYVCENCRNKVNIDSYFENNEVFIAYVENDTMGRRTKESVMAQELYNKLQTAGVNAFYQRISASDLIDNDYKKAIEISLNNSSVVIFVATTKENFDSLINTYYQQVKDKSIIPVYSQINAYNIPKEIANLQAINFDSIGAVSNIVDVVLQRTGKSRNIDIIIANKERNSKKNKMKLWFICVMTLIIVSVSLYIVFGTHYVLNSKKYKYAQSLTDDGEYLKAINIYHNIKDYRDSSNKLNNIYDKYNGYFYDESKTLCLHLNIDHNLNAFIEVTKSENDQYFSFITSAFVDINTIEFTFLDNQKSRGSGKLILLNDGIQLIVKTEQDNILSVGNLNILFNFTDRTDAPVISSVTISEILSWIKKETTEADLNIQNLNLEYVSTLGLDEEYLYRVKNTDYFVLFNNSEEMRVIGIYASFDELFPNKKSDKFEPVIIEDTFYIPANLYLVGAINLTYELGGIDIDCSESLYFVTSKNATTGIWENIVDSVNSFNSYNSSEGVKYYLEISPNNGSDTRTGGFDNLQTAVEEAKIRKDKGYIVVDLNGKVVYIP